MRVQETVVKEDMVVRKGFSKEKKLFTGGKSVLELPYTISFETEGNFNVHISGNQIIVEKIG